MTMLRIRLADLHAVAPGKPPGYLEAVLALGHKEGDDVLLTHSDYVQLRARFSSQPFGNNVRLRTPDEQDAALAVCSNCPELVDGRCRACRLCGGKRQVTNLVKLNTNRCPLKKWH